MNKTKIAWTDMTWNPVTGCTKCSPGCQNCYAEKMAFRLNRMHCLRYVNGFNVTIHPEALEEPTKTSGKHKIFVCSMSDLFHNEVPFEFIDKVMEQIKLCPDHTFIILSKRDERMAEYFAKNEVPINAWIGITVECKEAKKKIENLRKIKSGSVKFLSCEPLVEDLEKINLNGIDWLIAGGESGSQARPMKPQWLKNLKDECEKQNVPFFFKQWGTWGEDGKRRSKEKNGCKLEGKIIQQWPEKKLEVKNENM